MLSITAAERSWYVFGCCHDAVCLQLKALRESCGITRSHTDSWGAYTRHLDPEEHNPGTRHTEQSEGKHLTLRTRIKRLVRMPIRCSASIEMPDIVMELFVNRDACGLPM